MLRSFLSGPRFSYHFAALALSAALLTITTSADAQRAPRNPRLLDRKAWNAVYLEAGGAGGWGSINYELRPTHKFSARLGVSPGGPLMMATLLAGKGDDLLELSLGSMAWFEEDRTVIFLVASIGYRYHPGKPGHLFRIGVAPIIALNEEEPFGPMFPGGLVLPGISGGAAF